MRKNRMVALAATTAFGLAALTACSSGNGGGSTTGDATTGGEAPAGDNVELKLWLLTQEPSQKEGINTIVAGFEEAHPGITVTVEERQTDAHKDALRQVAGTDAGPDIYFYWEGPGLGGELVDAGMSLDLTGYYDEYGWQDRFSDATLTGITQYGGFHGVPWTQQAQALYYNKTLFEQAGITDEPATYDDLIAAADELVAAGITPIQFGGTVNWHVMRLLDNILETECGAETHDALNASEASWAEESCVAPAFTELKTWADQYTNAGFMGVSNDESSQLFFTGDAAMALEGTWFDAQVVDNGMDPETVGIFAFPTGTGRLYGFGEALYITATSAHPDEAAVFLDYMSDVEAQTATRGAWGATSVNKNVEPTTDNPLHALWPPIFEAGTGLFMNNDQNFSLDVTTEYWRIQNAVITGEIDPADAGAQLQRFIDSNS